LENFTLSLNSGDEGRLKNENKVCNYIPELALSNLEYILKILGAGLSFVLQKVLE
jgi:hypothetical protein